ncbi:MAG TPA: glycosyl transferase family 2 [Bacteroidales bacterium]|nr:glycosyl transferase family 2 [Bacteroidales bacterium]
MVKTAVVILNWNGIGWLKKFLETTLKFSGSNDTMVYLADNGSTDGSMEWAAQIKWPLGLIQLETNHGFAGGYNLALSCITAKYFVLLNSDAEVTDGWLRPLTDYMDNNPDVAACQPKIKSYNNKDYFEYAGAAGGYIDKFGFTFCRGRIFDKVEKDEGQYDSTADIFWASGACMMVRSDAWKKCGGFDDDFFAHMEEVDLCWRFHLAGYRVACLPESVIYHAGGGTLPYDTERKTYLNFRNNLFLLYKNLPESKLKKIIFLRKILDGIAAVMFLLKGRPESFIAVRKAHKDFDKSINSLQTKRETVKSLTLPETGNCLLNISIVSRFYLRGQRLYSSLVI